MTILLELQRYYYVIINFTHTYILNKIKYKKFCYLNNKMLTETSENLFNLKSD